MQLHDLQRKNKLKTKRQIGRGGKRGTTSGRGTKGQKARSGHRLRPEIRDQIKKIPKKRGYRFSGLSPSFKPINLRVIDQFFQSGETVSPANLVKKGILRRTGANRLWVKIVAVGDINKGVIISGCRLSTTAKEKIIKAGGQVKD